VLATGLDRVLELDVEKGTVTCEAGVSIDTLMRVLIPIGWFPTVVPGTRYVTVGGAIASDIHGKYRLGSFCDAVTRLTLATPGAGPMTVGPDEQPDVFWATAGGMGLTGIVTEATMGLQPLETSRMRVDTERATDVDDCMAKMLSDDSRYRYSVAWIDCLASGARLGRSVLTRGNHARLEELAPRDRKTASVFAPTTRIRTPRWMPNGLLNSLTVRAFNELWFRKAPRAERDAIQSMTQFFHPLDAVEGWNRIYGSHGFLQYQFVVPYGAEAVVRRTLERLSAARCASFLAVLKRFEHENPGPLSFPMPGWTLTLDIPAGRSGVFELLDGLDDLVVEAGGRVYLTKDSRVRPELMAAMYPELERWRAARAGVDPGGVMRSDLSRRLGLVSEKTAA
jgi:decaprenylphospho-beta-D-ribofuranose 2-oxidase